MQGKKVNRITCPSLFIFSFLQILVVSAATDNVVKVLRRISVDKNMAVVVVNGVTSSESLTDLSERFRFDFFH